ncbi:uncharacterized protein GVI51_D02035 [Nakaseomyces glabratus]|uniref:Mitochondrial intermediate peptidase n=1 Tax=Candida glabrata (strain ATCC 2001 / BCRC 20586 / JCM 3761 / NBRC 0622 / NRRL Y-65 / CBS 138) TaxID=284593 RepID=PMIP_CANGA|nr:uncharacterized protein CAGL0D02112g [Nakaseomyces glabratus]Q6FW88.1 RecName: Full=Mitochondrial intermediate peptidase; Short=MIP; AltName: Full=Octapeptidyl aminopeptidase; Flags: Precursor [Nakaseomyces glabratus CBS 138]KAH7589775.1 Peptidase family M3 [Nakaseomyces glabratus]KAH7590856.1 Peptidase family M3 [Nakaseomyces glabratus]KAH7596592.1 Peptidase family M3 [Nakaseomyces glabratus]KAH7606448.1 Peptidase family M3 [Nakaseomyces glabratus]KAH7614872.1 Peptidase family M3 [Nakaseo|eukprot:XP_445506.1 uncharacterized protein CAGL0D02112g [[Candida] glabrata]
MLIQKILLNKEISRLPRILSILNYTGLRWLSGSSGRNTTELQRIFDDSKYWQSLSENTTQYTKETGLFKNPYLTSTDGLRQFSHDSLHKAHKLAEILRNSVSKEEKVHYIMNLDQLSDTLCRVIDLCEFLRSAHPDQSYVEAAQMCHEEMFEFMNVLNTDVVLCNKLKEVLEDPEILKVLSEEERKVGEILLDDFEKSGIYMKAGIREQFIELSQQISVIGQEFINNTDYVAKEFIKVKRDEMDKSGISPLLTARLNRDLTGKYYKIPTYGQIPLQILKSCPDEDIRKEVWAALHNCPKAQIQRLNQLVRLRVILSNLLGKQSYSDYQLDNKMAGSPENVKGFIKTLMNVTKPLAARELEFIARDKLNAPDSRHMSDNEILSIVKPWDKNYFSSKYDSDNEMAMIRDEQLRYYFSLGNVINGLSELFKRIYGITLQPSRTENGETWSPDVRRLDVISEEEGLVGVIYCDLFERVGKISNPAHFTVCCSRQVYPDENDFTTIQTGQNSDGTVFQLPVISLVCNFSTVALPNGNRTCFLHMNEIETLFHEMGHAMHSMLGRTRLQNISGTRCATDFVELPSILMEHFARDIRVLRTIGSHYETSEPAPEALLNDYLDKTQFLQHCETYSQAKMAMLDQKLHGSFSLSDIERIDSAKIYQKLETRLQVLADDESNWCGRFGHLFGYGATYYSYLFDRAIASKVWDSLFKDDPFNRTGGEKFKERVLKWGGLKNPWSCIADVLEKPDLAKGGAEAMTYIGDSEDL